MSDPTLEELLQWQGRARDEAWYEEKQNDALTIGLSGGAATFGGVVGGLLSGSTLSGFATAAASAYATYLARSVFGLDKNENQNITDALEVLQEFASNLQDGEVQDEKRYLDAQNAIRILRESQDEDADDPELVDYWGIRKRLVDRLDEWVTREHAHALAVKGEIAPWPQNYVRDGELDQQAYAWTLRLYEKRRGEIMRGEVKPGDRWAQVPPSGEFYSPLTSARDMRPPRAPAQPRPEGAGDRITEARPARAIDTPPEITRPAALKHPGRNNFRHTPRHAHAVRSTVRSSGLTWSPTPTPTPSMTPSIRPAS